VTFLSIVDYDARGTSTLREKDIRAPARPIAPGSITSILQERLCRPATRS